MKKGPIVVIGSIPPPHHGSNVMCRYFVQTLKNLGHDVILIEKRFSRKQEDIGKPQLRKFTRLPCILVQLALVRMRCRPRMAIYFISVAKPALLVDTMLVLCLRSFGIPYVLYFHGKGYRSLAQTSRLWNRIINSVFSAADGGIVLGDRLKEDVCSFISDNKLIKVPNFVPWAKVSERPDIGTMPIKVLYLSNIQPSKGALEFLCAAKQVIANSREVRFVLAGPFRNNEFKSQILSYIEKHELTNYIDLPGGVYGEEKEKLFSESDIFVFPTKNEALPLVNIEAMRAGLPVISSSEGAIPEVVQHGETGFIVDPSSTSEIAHYIMVLAQDGKLRKKMGKAARQAFEEKYTPEAYTSSVRYAMEFFLNNKELLISDQRRILNG